MTTTLIIPGLRSSGPTHWQTWFEQQISGTVRVVQRDWEDASLADWSGRVRREIARAPGRVILVAHSFGALAAAQAASDHEERIAAAMFVAPADPEKFSGADYLPEGPFRFPSVLVASSTDPWMTFEKASLFADRWGSKLVNLGAAGHINAASGFGPWPDGLAIFRRLEREIHSQPYTASLRSNQTRTFRQRTVGLSRATVAQPQRLRALDRRNVSQAAALLKEVGWTVAPPSSAPRVATA